MKPARTADATEQLARLVRTSPLLDRTLKSHWLQVLPHLSPADRERLRAILMAAADE